MAKATVTEPKEKKNTARLDHPAVTKLKKDEKVKELPKDFDFVKHRPIKRTAWERDDMFFDHLALKYEGLMKQNKDKAKECRLLGSAAERTRAKRLLKMTVKIEELKIALRGKGIDVDRLLASIA